MTIDQIVNVVEIAIHKLPYMENLYQQAKDQAEKMQCAVQRLANDIRALEHKISILDKIAFSLEQDCRRKYQEIRELIAQKDKIEKLIAKVLNNDEGYSMLKQFVKESIKAVLAENKQLISVSFAALIQTLKNDPQMVNLIYRIPNTANDEEYKDSNNNITKYLESNKDKILYLAEKNYENLVETLTNNTVNSAAASNSTLLLPQSSFTFSSSSGQSNTYRIEESESFHNSKGDIAE
jgi:hypothetical protein